MVFGFVKGIAELRSALKKGKSFLQPATKTGYAEKVLAAGAEEVTANSQEESSVESSDVQAMREETTGLIVGSNLDDSDNSIASSAADLHLEPISSGEGIADSRFALLDQEGEPIEMTEALVSTAGHNQIDRASFEAMVRSFVRCLPGWSRDAEIILDYLGWGRGKVATNEQLAKKYALSHARINQIIKKQKEALRSNQHLLDDFWLAVGELIAGNGGLMDLDALANALAQRFNWEDCPKTEALAVVLDWNPLFKPSASTTDALGVGIRCLSCERIRQNLAQMVSASTESSDFLEVGERLSNDCKANCPYCIEVPDIFPSEIISFVAPNLIEVQPETTVLAVDQIDHPSSASSEELDEEELGKAAEIFLAPTIAGPPLAEQLADLPLSEVIRTAGLDSMIEADWIELANVARMLGHGRFQSFQKTRDEPAESLLELGLSARSFNCLVRSGIMTVEDLLRCTPTSLLRLQSFGVKCLTEVVVVLRERQCQTSGEFGDSVRSVSSNEDKKGETGSFDGMIRSWAQGVLSETRDTEITLARLGLELGISITHRELAEQYGLSTGRIQQIVKKQEDELKNHLHLLDTMWNVVEDAFGEGKEAVDLRFLANELMHRFGWTEHPSVVALANVLQINPSFCVGENAVCLSYKKSSLPITTLKDAVCEALVSLGAPSRCVEIADRVRRDNLLYGHVSDDQVRATLYVQPTFRLIGRGVFGLSSWVPDPTKSRPDLAAGQSGPSHKRHDAPVPIVRADSIDSTSFETMVRSFVSQVLEKTRDIDIFLGRLGVGSDGVVTLAQLAKRFGLSIGRVQQISKRQIGLLEEHVHALDEFWQITQQAVESNGGLLELSSLSDNLVQHFGWEKNPASVAIAGLLELNPSFKVNNYRGLEYPRYVSASAADLPKAHLDPAVVEQLTDVLSTHFSNGYRLNSPIEMARFRSFAAEDLGEEITLSDDELKSYIAACGTAFDGKVYTVSVQSQERIKELADEYFSDGAQAIFFAEFYAKNENWLFGASVVSEDMLIGVLRRLFPKLSFTQTYFGYTDASVFATLESEIHRVWGDDVLLTYEQLALRLQYIPLERIKYALGQNGDFIWSSVETFSHVSRIDINDDERQAIRDAAVRECNTRGYASITDLPFGEIEERNYELSVTAVHNAVYRICLSDKFDKKGKIVTRKGDIFDALTIMKEYCRTIDKCSLDDLLNFERELTGEVHRWIPMEAGNTILVRIDKHTYVANRYVHFDADVIDEAIGLFVKGDYLPLKSFTTFGAFPDCGQTWNLFLLESYCRRFSRKFRFDFPSVNSRNAGAVIRRSCGMNYAEIMTDAVANADVPLKDAVVGRFLYESGYTGRSTTAKVGEIIDKAKAIREGRARNVLLYLR